MKVGVIGSLGRMGSTICEAVEAKDGLELVARIDAGDDLGGLLSAGVEVVVDVTNVDAARDSLPWLADKGINAVVGTTGFSRVELDTLDHEFINADRRCFVVPNFSIGAVLLMQFAEKAAPYFDGVEVIEFHHDKKKDAPSGTAQLTASKIAAARTEPWAPDLTEVEAVDGVRGGEIDGVRVHSVRLNGLLAHEEVIFGSAGQTLTLRHDSFDRSSFTPGVLLAIASVSSLPAGVTVGLDQVLDLR